MISAIGIDLGGSNLRAGAFGDEITEARVPVTVARQRELVGEPRDPITIVERVPKDGSGALCTSTMR